MPILQQIGLSEIDTLKTLSKWEKPGIYSKPSILQQIGLAESFLLVHITKATIFNRLAWTGK